MEEQKNPEQIIEHEETTYRQAKEINNQEEKQTTYFPPLEDVDINNLNDRKASKVGKKHIILIGISAIVIGLIITLCIIFFGPKKDYVMYIKDNDIFFNNLKSNSAIPISSDLLKNAEEWEGDEYLSSVMGILCYVSENRKIVFYPDKIDTEDDGYSLYYKELNKQNAEPVKINSNIVSYSVNEKATLVTYLKGNDDNSYSYDIYQYDIKKDEDYVISREVQSAKVSKNGERILYTNSEDSLYLYHTKSEDKEKIDNDIEDVIYYSKDLKTVIYQKEDALYKKTINNEKEKIADNIDDIIVSYGFESNDDGIIYFTVTDSDTLKLSTFVTDDMKSEDELISAPKKPYSWEYDTNSAYQIALKQYNLDKVKYDSKVFRDNLRRSIANLEADISICQLCCYDGKNLTVLSEMFINDYSYDYSNNSAVLIFPQYNGDEYPTIKISAITRTSLVSSAISEIENSIKEELDKNAERAVAIDDTISMLNVNDEIEDFILASDGSAIFFYDNYDKNKEYAELYQIEISKNTLKDAVQLDTDVRVGYNYLFSDGNTAYFKDVDKTDETGTLYFNQKKVASDVYLEYIDYDINTKQLVYFTDWDEDDECGTLNVYKNNKAKKISDDVHTVVFSVNGSILYLRDFSINSKKGDLFIYKNKSKKIDIDVSGILPVEYIEMSLL